MKKKDMTEEQLKQIYHKHARDNIHREGELEVDDNAKVSISFGNGAYVQCWVWVSDSDVDL